MCDRVGSASGPVGPATMPLVHKGPNPFVLIGEQTKQAEQQLGFWPLPQRHGWAARVQAGGSSGHRSRIRGHGERGEGEGFYFGDSGHGRRGWATAAAAATVAVAGSSWAAQHRQ